MRNLPVFVVFLGCGYLVLKFFGHRFVLDACELVFIGELLNHLVDGIVVEVTEVQLVDKVGVLFQSTEDVAVLVPVVLAGVLQSLSLQLGNFIAFEKVFWDRAFSKVDFALLLAVAILDSGVLLVVRFLELREAVDLILDATDVGDLFKGGVSVLSSRNEVVILESILFLEDLSALPELVFLGVLVTVDLLHVFSRKRLVLMGELVKHNEEFVVLAAFDELVHGGITLLGVLCHDVFFVSLAHIRLEVGVLKVHDVYLWLN